MILTLKHFKRIQFFLIMIVFLLTIGLAGITFNYLQIILPFGLRKVFFYNEITANILFFSLVFIYGWLLFHLLFFSLNYLLLKCLVKRRGIGSLSYETINSILKSKCSKCGSPINSSSLLSNSLYIENGNVHLICLKCRTGIDNTPPNKISIQKKLDLIDLMFKLKIAENEKYMNNHKLLSILRLLSFPHFKAENYKLLLRNTYTENMYGDINSLSYCGECGCFLKYTDDNIEENPEIDIKILGKCPYCGLPNEYQWNMRSSYLDEYNSLVH